MNLFFVLLLLFAAVTGNSADFYETDIKGDKVIIETIKDVKGEFDPILTLTKWNEEEYLKLTFKSDEKFKIDSKTIDNKVKVENDNMSIKYYTEGENMKVVIEFKKKPKTNTYSFELEGWENFNFYYQPPLTQDDIDDGCIRPNDVVGSYAIYHKTKKHNKYKVGKAFHIYRSKFVDTISNWAWVSLNIIDGLYTVTIPQVFLDNAVYPIKANDTFGNTVAGGSMDTVYDLGGNMYTLTESGGLTKMTMSSSRINNVSMKGLVYTNSAAYPAALQGATQGDAFNFTSPQQWVDLIFASTLNLDAGDYWLLTIESAEDSYCAYDTDTNDGYELADDGTYYTTPPDPFPGGASLRSGREYSIYATYTPTPAAAPSGAVPMILILQ